jgi:aminotransferase
MPVNLSKRHGLVLQSDIRSMTLECSRVGGINLAQGVCDLPLQPSVANGAREAIVAGINAYTRYDGLPHLRTALAHKYERCYGMALDPDTDIVVTCGATGAFYCACLSVLDPGDEVIVLEPYYGYHVNTIRAAGGVPVFVRLQGSDWALDVDVLAAAVSARTRAIVVNTPANPCGKVFTAAELAAVGALAQRHDLFVFTDEIYEHFVYDGRQHVPAATLAGLAERTITISGLSKTFAITGWRIGYAIGAARWMQAIGYLSDLVYVCAPAPLQQGAACGVDILDRGYYAALAASYQAKRDRVCAALAAAGLSPRVPQGAYYVLADLSAVPGADSKERAMRLLERTGVACVPGGAFYHDGAGDRLGRFCFAKDDAVIDEVCERLRRPL